jgi:general secretion pathway protein G
MIKKRRSLNFRLNQKHRSGFTLVEIMIVIMVVALIVAIAIPGYVRAKTNAMKYTCIGNLRQIDSAKAVWAVDYSEDPEMEDLVPDYIRRIPECPAGGSYTIGTVAGEASCSVSEHVAD